MAKRKSYRKRVRPLRTSSTCTARQWQLKCEEWLHRHSTRYKTTLDKYLSMPVKIRDGRVQGQIEYLAAVVSVCEDLRTQLIPPMKEKHSNAAES